MSKFKAAKVIFILVTSSEILSNGITVVQGFEKFLSWCV